MVRWFHKHGADRADQARPGVSDRTVFWLHFINVAHNNWLQAAHQMAGGCEDYKGVIQFRSHWAGQLGPSAVQLLRKTAEEVRQDHNHARRQQNLYTMLAQRLDGLATATAWLMHEGEGPGDDLAEQIANQEQQQQTFERTLPRQLRLLNEDLTVI